MTNEVTFQGEITGLQTNGDTLDFWTNNMPDDINRFRITNSSHFASVLMAALTKGWTVAVGYPSKGDSTREVLFLQAPPI